MPQDSRTSLLKWARESLVPLSTVDFRAPHKELGALGKMIGDATVVALSEGVHCAAEPLEFRNRLFRYLAEEKGFTAIAIESGIVEGRVVHDYVRGGAGDLDTALAQGISWTFDRLPQNRALVEWLKGYNSDPRHTRKINLYGFDMAGSPGNPQANREVETALAATLEYLRRVDGEAAVSFDARLASLMVNLRFALQRVGDSPGYERLSSAERDALTATIEDLIALIERREAVYMAASSAVDYEWGYRSAIAARQIDGWLRHVPLDWQPLKELPGFPNNLLNFLAPAMDARDRVQADNLQWILEREGPGGKILVFAARYHLSMWPVKSGYFGSDGVEGEQQVAGTYLKRRLGDRLVTIGNLLGQGNCGDGERTLGPPPPDSLDGLGKEIGSPFYLLDLRTAPDDVRRYLDQERLLAHPAVFKMRAASAFDILFYIDTVTPP